MSNLCLTICVSNHKVNLLPKDIARFWKFVPERPENGCWLWRGTPGDGKYGQLKVGGFRLLAHRISWTIANGEIPGKLFTLHKCDQPQCVRPDHLFLGTQLDNQQDMVNKGRSAKGDRSSARLHPEAHEKGDDHWSRRHPEWVNRGEDHWMQKYPERIARGDRQGTHTHPESIAKGERSGRHKLTEAVVLEIRSRYAMEGNQSALAREFGIHQGTVWQIVNRHTWTHI